ncbi:kinase-like domain-containing protein [Limtongia smithiae]|uniref:kinase-like domain-containing protein n=1 Tax=Limtongia smithiae TaxID=1125753 RepID=UPI0034CF378A
MSFLSSAASTTGSQSPSSFVFPHSRNVVVMNNKASAPASSPSAWPTSPTIRPSSAGDGTVLSDLSVSALSGIKDISLDATPEPKTPPQTITSPAAPSIKTPSLSTSSSGSASDYSDQPAPDSDLVAADDATAATAAASPEKQPPSSTELVVQVTDASTLYAGKKTINWFTILEDMGEGAYGQVKLAQYKPPRDEKVVLKYVTKKRILVETWIRDRTLGTIPLEIHVLKFLQQYPHRNVVDMLDFFEDETNYYIEMSPHGIPGMDLFDYVELRANMDEAECRSIFFQVASAVRHLHQVGVVHRDIKDENIILDSDGNIKLIDFGSAAYIKSGPFTVFVGTIDYAAPEVLRGQMYSGKEQDVWAAGILLYTIIYKENPFYDSAEIMSGDLRMPYVMSEESVSLIRRMLNRNIAARPTMEDVLNDPWLKGCGDTSDPISAPDATKGR